MESGGGEAERTTEARGGTTGSIGKGWRIAIPQSPRKPLPNGVVSSVRRGSAQPTHEEKQEHGRGRRSEHACFPHDSRWPKSGLNVLVRVGRTGMMSDLELLADISSRVSSQLLEQAVIAVAPPHPVSPQTPSTIALHGRAIELVAPLHSVEVATPGKGAQHKSNPRRVLPPTPVAAVTGIADARGGLLIAEVSIVTGAVEWRSTLSL